MAREVRLEPRQGLRDNQFPKFIYSAIVLRVEKYIIHRRFGYTHDLEQEIIDNLTSRQRSATCSIKFLSFQCLLKSFEFGSLSISSRDRFNGKLVARFCRSRMDWSGRVN